jgi:hypothetical protein
MVQKSKSKAGAATIASDDDDKTIPEDNWPKALQLRTGALTQQTDLIRVVCREAIRIVEKTLVTEHAWPVERCRVTHEIAYMQTRWWY